MSKADDSKNETLMNSNLALYIHIPFCRERCTYCAFNTFTDRAHLMDDYVQAVCQEIAYGAQDTPVHTIYFGGGTPSLLSVAQIVTILNAIYQHFTVLDTIEISMEANPGTVDEDYLRGLKQLGLSRLSLGAQSAQASELSLFGRWHDWSDVKQAVRDARRAGIDNLSLDLIYGNPQQSLAMWQSSVQAVLDLEPNHLSLYALGLEPGTPLTKQVKYGELPEPDGDLAADMYEFASDKLDQAGFIQYEISNWGQPGKFCEHNLQYWRNLPYLGIGAGAHGYANLTRTVNAMRPEDYIERLQNPREDTYEFPRTPATISAEEIDPATDQFETVFMGLRLLQEGLDLDAFAKRYNLRLEDKFQDTIVWLSQNDMLRLTDTHLFLTQRARLLSNQVFTRFMDTVD